MKNRISFLLIILSIYILQLYIRPLLVLAFTFEYLGTIFGTLLILSVLITAKYIVAFRTILLILIGTILVTIIPLTFSPPLYGKDMFIQSTYQITVSFTLFFCTKWIFELAGNKVIPFINFLIVIAAANTFIGYFLYFYGFNILTTSNIIGFNEVSGRIAGIRGENYTGYWAAPLFSGILFVLFTRNTKFFYKLILILIVLASVISIILGLSRTGIISITVTGLFTFANIITRSQKKISYAFIIAVFTIAIAAISFIYSKSSINRILDQHTINQEEERLNGDNRSFIWFSWLNTSIENPLGLGPGAIEEHLDQHYGAVPHNSFLDILVEYGFLGLAILILSLTYVFKNFNFKSSDFTHVTLMGAFLGMLTSLFFLSNPMLPLHYIIAGGIVGRNNWLKFFNSEKENSSPYKRWIR